MVTKRSHILKQTCRGGKYLVVNQKTEIISFFLTKTQNLKSHFCKQKWKKKNQLKLEMHSLPTLSWKCNRLLLLKVHWNIPVSLSRNDHSESGKYNIDFCCWEGIETFQSQFQKMIIQNLKFISEDPLEAEFKIWNFQIL